MQVHLLSASVQYLYVFYEEPVLDICNQILFTFILIELKQQWSYFKSVVSGFQIRIGHQSLTEFCNETPNFK